MVKKKNKPVTLENALEAFVNMSPSKDKVAEKTLASTGETQALPMYKEPTWMAA